MKNENKTENSQNLNKEDITSEIFADVDLFADELDERLNAGPAGVSSSTCISSASCGGTSSASCACCFSCLCTG